MNIDEACDARVLIIDDEPANVLLIEKLLHKHCFTQTKSTTDSMSAIPLFDAFQPDIVLLDLRMPGIDGFGIMDELRKRIQADDFIPVIVLTADASHDAKMRALKAGAQDFLTKPLDHAEVVARIRNLLQTRTLHLLTVDQKHRLEDRVKERTRQLKDTQVEVVRRLSLAAEFRDDATGQHTHRVGDLSSRIARILGLDSDFVQLIHQAAPLHDIGKVGIPDNILLKPGKLTASEWKIMKTHTSVGAKILSGSPHALLNVAEEIALMHHECFDGSGYIGLEGSKIPLSGRIVAVADVFDALTHDRPYKEAWPVQEAMAEIISQSGRQFDPEIVEAFQAAISQLDAEAQCEPEFG